MFVVVDRAHPSSVSSWRKPGPITPGRGCGAKWQLRVPVTPPAGGYGSWLSPGRRGRGTSRPRPSRRHRSRLAVDLREHLARDPKTVDRSRHATIDCDLHQDLADLVAADAVGECALQMRAEFVLTIEDRDHRDVEHAAGLARQLLAAPHRAPAIFVEHLLKRTVEIVDALQSVVDIGLAEHRFADFQALVVHLLVHGVSFFFLGWRRGNYGVATGQSRPRVMREKGCLPYRNGCLSAAVVVRFSTGQPGELIERRHPRPVRPDPRWRRSVAAEAGASPATGHLCHRVGACLAKFGAASYRRRSVPSGVLGRTLAGAAVHCPRHRTCRFRRRCDCRPVPNESLPMAEPRGGSGPARPWLWHPSSAGHHADGHAELTGPGCAGLVAGAARAHAGFDQAHPRRSAAAPARAA